MKKYIGTSFTTMFKIYFQLDVNPYKQNSVCDIENKLLMQTSIMDVTHEKSWTDDTS